MREKALCRGCFHEYQSKGDVSTIKERGTIQIRGTRNNGGNQLENKREREREREQRGYGRFVRVPSEVWRRENHTVLIKFSLRIKNKIEKERDESILFFPFPSTETSNLSKS
jgi:hypothetical protein